MAQGGTWLCCKGEHGCGTRGGGGELGCDARGYVTYTKHAKHAGVDGRIQRGGCPI